MMHHHAHHHPHCMMHRHGHQCSHHAPFMYNLMMRNNMMHSYHHDDALNQQSSDKRQIPPTKRLSPKHQAAPASRQGFHGYGSSPFSDARGLPWNVMKIKRQRIKRGHKGRRNPHPISIIPKPAMIRPCGLQNHILGIISGQRRNTPQAPSEPIHINA